ncbi:MAG: glycosyltransferase family 9 protein [Deltaproteobacteria bacterium]|nr:glycosyltransferase family 9 protein [Deltaproteobacteria bacterium]
MLGSRILVCHQGALGDLILALPAIKALRDVLQPARMEMMGHPWTLALINGHPYADAVIDINRSDMAPFFPEAAPLPGEICRYLGQFAAAFCFARSETLAYNLRRAGIRQTFTLPSFPDKRMHVIDHHLLSLQALGIAAPPTPPTILPPPQGAQEEAKAFFLRKGWDLDKIIALHPGAGSRKKAWPAARFAALARALASIGHKILIIEGPADEAAVAEVVAGLGDIPYLLVQDLPITKVAALIGLASLFIGNDSGISHVAAALNVPIIALFGPTDPFVWAPRNARAFWLRGQAACAPCTRDEQRLCERQQCLDSIQVEAVIKCIAEKGMISDFTALDDRTAIPIEKRDQHYGEKGHLLPPL